MSVLITITGTSTTGTIAGLDDPAVHRGLDRGCMFDAIKAFPDQLRQAPRLADQVDWHAYKPTTPAGVCVCGMGGSAIGGDLVRSYWEYESPVPMVVVRSDRLPEYVNRFWMVIASSYSGNTQETLSAVEDARQRGSNILAISSGGRLVELAQSLKWPVIRVPGGLMPRSAIGYSFGPVMLALIRWGVVPDRTEAMDSAATALSRDRSHYSLEIPTTANPAKQAALALVGRFICVYGTTGYTDVAALRLKCQFSENAKAVAFANSLPEVNHNEIVGIDATADSTNMALVVLRSGDETDDARRRLDWVIGRYTNRAIPVVQFESDDGDRMTSLLSLVQAGDYVSYFLAIAAGNDPSPIPAIEALKAELK